MVRLPNPVRSILLVTSLALAVAACGSGGSSGDPGIATLSSPGPGSSAAAAPSEAPVTDPQQAFLAYARCMRENGIDMPDPDLSKGGVTMTGKADSAAGQQAFAAADEVCRKHLAGITVSGGSGGGLPPELQDAMLSFAKCMRDNGIEMSDPKFEADGRIDFGGEINPNDPAFPAAQAACEPILQAVGGGRAAGPGESPSN